ncbi:hypothetical protein BcDW1_6849 [Botrytis cinerea BcDW1]|uniref:Uncharacterized protein n=1 Tax=Botryotinia fuckeliana (strain BcDW1) TaxID=1290391 RepID=M7TTJ3_BOTF1|nr:hypothetical protein BcDW1_6849 [Botrytis cinerea BcDW1]
MNNSEAQACISTLYTHCFNLLATYRSTECSSVTGTGDRAYHIMHLFGYDVSSLRKKGEVSIVQLAHPNLPDQYLPIEGDRI